MLLGTALKYGVDCSDSHRYRRTSPGCWLAGSGVSDSWQKREKKKPNLGEDLQRSHKKKSICREMRVKRKVLCGNYSSSSTNLGQTGLFECQPKYWNWGVVWALKLLSMNATQQEVRIIPNCSEAAEILDS